MQQKIQSPNSKLKNPKKAECDDAWESETTQKSETDPERIRLNLRNSIKNHRPLDG